MKVHNIRYGVRDGLVLIWFAAGASDGIRLDLTEELAKELIEKAQKGLQVIEDLRVLDSIIERRRGEG